MSGLKASGYQNRLLAHIFATVFSVFDRRSASHVNDAIERTHRLTGMPRDEIVRRGIVRDEIPIYGLGGLAVMGGPADQSACGGNE